MISLDCWLWSEDLNNSGYGAVWDNELAKVVGAHVYMYTHLVGPIPDRLELDHLCRRRRCTNPEHLEPVTKSENQRRACGDFCPCGAPYTAWGTAGKRRCKPCHVRKRRELGWK